MEGVAISMNLILPLAMLANGLNSGNISLFKLSAVQLMMGGMTLPYLSANNTVPESKSSGWNSSQHAKESAPVDLSPSVPVASEQREDGGEAVSVSWPKSQRLTQRRWPQREGLGAACFLSSYSDNDHLIPSLLSFSPAPFLFKCTGTHPTSGDRDAGLEPCVCIPLKVPLLMLVSSFFKKKILLLYFPLLFASFLRPFRAVGDAVDFMP